MDRRRNPKNNTGVKIFILAIFLVPAILLGFRYLYTPSQVTPPDDKTPVATTTPVVTKPKPFVALGLSLSSRTVLQGEPILVTVNGLYSTSSIRSFTFDGKPFTPFIHDDQVTALMGVDLHAPTGTFPILLVLNDGRQFRDELTIQKRPEVVAPYSIPEKLGGNSYESIRTLVSTLAEEGRIINRLPVIKDKLWKETFQSPLSRPMVIEDPFGYTRLIGNFTMPHKGTDIVEVTGAPVYAMNRGIVVLATSMRNYGNTIIIDHGSGLQTVYMHLAEINVLSGQMVEKGDLIGKVGETGYALSPHLHLTVRIWDISVDAMKFIEILGEK